ncbi:MAG: alpha/beta hydrolase [Gammaproteobacteria bacterium]|nr:alpha/beta hydrolase [Gammaproteobacteria bacterium]
MRMLVNLLIGAALVYLALLAAMYFNQHRLLYLPNVPTRELAATPDRYGLAYEDVRFETEDGITLHGWFLPVAGATRTVLFFHGNAGNISHRLDSLALFVGLGLQVLIIDYRGYGESAGKPSEAGTYRDATAAWRYLTATRGIASQHIVLFGRSLGGAVAIELASRVAPGALIVESSFTSVPEMAANLYPLLPVRWLARLHYHSLDRITAVPCPVLVLHSEHDEIIPIAHGRRLYEAAPHPKVFFAMRGGHNDGFFASGEDYVRALGGFLETHAGGRG